MADCEHGIRVQAFHDGELSPEQAGQLEQHLRRCPICSQELRELEDLSRQIQELGHAELPAGLLDRLEERVSGASSGDAALARIAAWFTAAAATVLFAGSLMLWKHTASESGAPDMDPAGGTMALETMTVNRTFTELGEVDPAPEVEIAFWIVDQLAQNNGHH